METQVESILSALADSPGLAYLFLFLTSVIENLFPPIPGDVIMIFGASLAGQGVLGVGMVFASTASGSLTGMVLAYAVGWRYGRRLLLSGRVPWFRPDRVAKAERWFSRWGWWVVLSNRFLSVIRAVISLSAGLTGMSFTGFVLFALISIVLWNGCLIAGGVLIGRNFRLLMDLLMTYNWIVAGLLALTVVAVLLFRYRNHRSAGAK